jgi:hypothetical protein
MLPSLSKFSLEWLHHVLGSSLFHKFFIYPKPLLFLTHCYTQNVSLLNPASDWDKASPALGKR